MDKRFPLEDQIEMLATALRGRVILPRHADYDATRMVALANFDRRPAALIRVANATDVAAVLNFAQATDLPVAVRSGGHSTMGFGGCDGGLVIDLRDLNTIDIDPAAKTAWVGTGLTAGEVTQAVEKHGLVVSDIIGGLADDNVKKVIEGKYNKVREKVISAKKDNYPPPPQTGWVPTLQTLPAGSSSHSPR